MSAVKVVLIDTQYVETDVGSFKSVVQRLTGKDSCVAWIEESEFVGRKKRKIVAGENNIIDDIKNGGEVEVRREGGGTGNCEKILSESLSLKDLDRLMLEMPPSLEELLAMAYEF